MLATNPACFAQEGAEGICRVLIILWMSVHMQMYLELHP